jgi:hypothetical protein
MLLILGYVFIELVPCTLSTLLNKPEIPFSPESIQHSSQFNLLKNLTFGEV